MQLRRDAITAAMLTLFMLPATSPGQTRESRIQVSYDDTMTIVQKDFGGERWSVTFRRADGAVMGNVFFTDERAPAFLSCSVLAATEDDLTYRCASADPCVEGPCNTLDYETDVDPVSVPRDFFLPPEDDDPLAFVQDLSTFSVFRLEQKPALGFCPATEHTFAAEIRSDGDGGFTLTQSFLEEGDRDDPNCLEEILGDMCLVPVERPPRPLDADEAAQLRAAFETLVLSEKEDPICEFLAVDPCRINSFAWDDVRASEFVCSSRRVSREQSLELIDLLDGFGGK